MDNIVWCPKCKNVRLGNYCSECGTPLERMPRKKVECPCCRGSGQIEEFGPQWARWAVSEPKVLLNSSVSDLINENSELFNRFSISDIKLSQE